MNSRPIRVSGDPLPRAVDGRVRDLLQQQAALRELAVAVAEARPADVIYELVAKQAAEVSGVDSGAVVHFRGDGIGELVGSWRIGGKQTGALISLSGAAGAATVARTGHSARTSATEATNGQVFGGANRLSTMPGVAVPIRSRGELWGSLHVFSGPDEALPTDLEDRLDVFADLVGFAITNTDASARLLSLATSDPLTGLLNHRAFQERVESEVSRARRYGRPLSVMLMDLDHFKTINDAYGHQAGDAALMQAARLLEAGARAGDVLARIGGDEFAMLLPETSAQDVLPIAERWSAEFRVAPVGVAVELTMSAGVCDLEHANGSKELLRLADTALYWAKAHGRNSVVAYSPDTVDDWSSDVRGDRMTRLQSFASIRSLAVLVDAKESPNGNHSERVAALVRRLAESAGWQPGQVDGLVEAAQIHDVGKIAVPQAILRKPARLTAEEYDLVKTHVALGTEIARGALDEHQALWIEQHHERFDGKGYPNGLAGAEITQGATLLALADSWDVMTVGRTYSESKTDSEALAECISLSGTQFSPDACDALRSLEMDQHAAV
jgi:diguanylate cyclase (GGDEF)-like protein